MREGRGGGGEVREILVRVSAALASRDRGRLERALARAAEGAPADAVEEALLQSYLFLGYPVALEGFALWRAVSGGKAAPASEGSRRGSWEGWRKRGARVCETVYGSQYGRLRDNVRRLHPDLEEWMVIEGYGKVLGRPGLGLVERELCIVALLAVLDAPRQLHSHLRGAVNAGAEPAEIDAALEAALEYVSDPDGRERSRAVWERVRRRAAERGGADGRGGSAERAEAAERADTVERAETVERVETEARREG